MTASARTLRNRIAPISRLGLGRNGAIGKLAVTMPGPSAPRARRSYARLVMRATMSYTILRLLLFFAVLLILYWVGIGGIMLVALAAVISALISYVVLSRLRDSMSISLTGRLGRVRQRLDDGASSEDTD